MKFAGKNLQVKNTNNARNYWKAVIISVFSRPLSWACVIVIWILLRSLSFSESLFSKSMPSHARSVYTLLSVKRFFIIIKFSRPGQCHPQSFSHFLVLYGVIVWFECGGPCPYNAGVFERSIYVFVFKREQQMSMNHFVNAGSGKRKVSSELKFIHVDYGVSSFSWQICNCFVYSDSEPSSIIQSQFLLVSNLFNLAPTLPSRRVWTLNTTCVISHFQNNWKPFAHYLCLQLKLQKQQ